MAVTLAGNRLGPDVNLTRIAEALEGYTGSDIKEVTSGQFHHDHILGILDIHLTVVPDNVAIWLLFIPFFSLL